MFNLPRWLINYRLPLAIPICLLTACTFSRPPLSSEPYEPLVFPSYWESPSSTTEPEACPTPVGLFSNIGASSPVQDEEIKLSNLLFENKLQGYPVEAIQIGEIPNSENLLVQGVLGGQVLSQSLPSSVIGGNSLESNVVLEPSGDDCADKWRIKVKTDAVNSTMVSASIMYTGGLLMPLNETSDMTLHIATDGALLIRLDVNVWILGALMIPMNFKQEYWLRFEPFILVTDLSDPILEKTPNETSNP